MSNNTTNNIKKLFSFIVNKEIETEKVEESTNEAGEVVKVTKKVKENTPVSFYLRQPNRKIREDAEFFYYSKLSEAVKHNILPIILLEKHLANDNGSLSKDELSTIQVWRDKNLEFQRLGAKPEKNRTEDDKKNLNKVTEEIDSLWVRVKVIQQNKGSIFNASAENWANQKLIFWYTLALAQNDDNSPFFIGDTYEDRLKNYDVYEDKEDLFYSMVISKFLLYTSLYQGMRDQSTTEEFRKEAQKIEDTWNAPKEEEKKQEKDVKTEESKIEVKSEVLPEEIIKQ